VIIGDIEVIVWVGGSGVDVGLTICVGAGVADTQDTINKHSNKYSIILNVRIAPSLDLGIPQIKFLNNTIALFRVEFNRFGKVIFPLQ
jgi:hypothetical protein